MLNVNNVKTVIPLPKELTVEGTINFYIQEIENLKGKGHCNKFKSKIELIFSTNSVTIAKQARNTLDVYTSSIIFKCKAITPTLDLKDHIPLSDDTEADWKSNLTELFTKLNNVGKLDLFEHNK